MPNEVQIKIKATDETKEGFDSAANAAAAGAKKVEDAVEGAGSNVTGIADKVGHTGEVAAKMAVNLAQALGLSGKDGEKLIELFRRIDDGFDAAGKAAYLAATANTAFASSNTAVSGTAGIAVAAVRGLTAAMIANPITATLVGIGIAAAAVAVAFEVWPKAEENVEELNKKLKEQRELIDAIEGAAQKRFHVASQLEQLEERAEQKAQLKLISEIKSVEVAELAAKLAADRATALNAEKEGEETKLRALSAQLAVLEKQRDEQHLTEESSAAGLQHIQEMKRIEEEINKLVSGRIDFEKQIANFKSQAEAAQDRALALPAEQKKAEEDAAKKALEATEKQTKAEVKLAEVRAKSAADRLEAEDDYGMAIEEMNKLKREAAEDEKKDKEKLEKDADKGGPKIVGLEELGRNIQLAAAKTNKDEALISLSKDAAIKRGEMLELAKKTFTVSEAIAVESAKTAEQIAKVGTLI